VTSVEFFSGCCAGGLHNKQVLRGMLTSTLTKHLCGVLHILIRHHEVEGTYGNNILFIVKCNFICFCVTVKRCYSSATKC
jgi:hypothetical protein